MHSTSPPQNINPLWLGRACKRYLSGSRSVWTVLDELLAQLRFGQQEIRAFRGSLAAACGLSPRTFDRAKLELAELGFLSWEQTRVPGRRGPRRGPNRYKLHLAAIWDWVQAQRAPKAKDSESIEVGDTAAQEATSSPSSPVERIESPAAQEATPSLKAPPSPEERTRVTSALEALIASLRGGQVGIEREPRVQPPDQHHHVERSVDPPPSPPPMGESAREDKAAGRAAIPGPLAAILDSIKGKRAVREAYQLHQAKRI